MNVNNIRDQFPITKVVLQKTDLAEERKLIFMDHGASTHAPTPVLNKYLNVMQNQYANVHRGEHTLSQISTYEFEEVSNILGKLAGINSLENSAMQVMLTSNTTSSLDLVSHIFHHIPGDYLTTVMEHHSNDLPHRRRGKVHHIEVDNDGILLYDMFEEKLQKEHIKLVCVSAGSNVTGYMPDIHKIAKLAHENGAKILVDAAQRMAHKEINMKHIDHPEHIDFLAAGGHKMYAPFGASFVIGNKSDSDDAPPYIPGGGTVKLVTVDDAKFLNGPDRHQFGTPNIGGSIAMGEAGKFLMDIRLNHIREHEEKLLQKMLKGLEQIPDVKIYGKIPLSQKIGVVAFNIGDHNHAIVSRLFDRFGGVATRNGTFCAQPYMQRLLQVSQDEITVMKTLAEDMEQCTSEKMTGAVRATIGIYNTEEEVDTFLSTVEKIQSMPVEKVKMYREMVS